jgi:hypothetical protein
MNPGLEVRYVQTIRSKEGMLNEKRIFGTSGQFFFAWHIQIKKNYDLKLQANYSLHWRDWRMIFILSLICLEL